MRRLVKILLAVATLTTVSCRELPDYLVSDDTIARVGRNELSINEIDNLMPSNLKGEDSVTYVKQYVDRWIVRQLKVEEADRLFSSSEREIDRLVEEYRQTLLSSRVDQHYVEEQSVGDVTDEDIAEYYNTHKSDFVLDRTLVKGRVLCFDKNYRQHPFRDALSLSTVTNYFFGTKIAKLAQASSAAASVRAEPLPTLKPR